MNDNSCEMEKCSCIHCSERRMAISSTMVQFLEFAHISCYTSTCIVSMMLFCVNKEAILLSIQIIIKIFIFFYSWCFFLLIPKARWCIVQVAGIVMVTNTRITSPWGRMKNSLPSHTRFHPFLDYWWISIERYVREKKA